MQKQLIFGNKTRKFGIKDGGKGTKAREKATGGAARKLAGSGATEGVARGLADSRATGTYIVPKSKNTILFESSEKKGGTAAASQFSLFITSHIAAERHHLLLYYSVEI